MMDPKVAHKFLEFARLLTKIPRRTNQFAQPGERDAFKGCRREHFCATHLGDGPFHVGPTGILRQDGPDDDLEPGTPRPPMLRAVCTE